MNDDTTTDVPCFQFQRGRDDLPWCANCGWRDYTHHDPIVWLRGVLERASDTMNYEALRHGVPRMMSRECVKATIAAILAEAEKDQ